MIIVNEHGVVIGIVNENTVILKEEYIINKSEVIIGKSDSIRIVIEAEKEGDKIDGIYNK